MALLLPANAFPYKPRSKEELQPTDQFISRNSLAWTASHLSHLIQETSAISIVILRRPGIFS